MAKRKNKSKKKKKFQRGFGWERARVGRNFFCVGFLFCFSFCVVFFFLFCLFLFVLSFSFCSLVRLISFVCLSDYFDMIFCFFFFLFLSCFSFSPLHQENDNGECVANYLSSNGFQGQVGLPGSQLYNQSINIDNVFAVKYPAIAVAPSNDQDVATTIAARQFCNVGNMSILRFFFFSSSRKN